MSQFIISLSAILIAAGVGVVHQYVYCDEQLVPKSIQRTILGLAMAILILIFSIITASVGQNGESNVATVVAIISGIAVTGLVILLYRLYQQKKKIDNIMNKSIKDE